MHFLLVLLLSFLSPCFARAANANQELMTQAEDAFKKGDFTSAQKLYSALSGNHVIQEANPAAYLYNLATMAAKTENYAFAYALLLQAQKLSPFDKDIAGNLNFVRAHIDPQAAAIHPAGFDPAALPVALLKYSTIFLCLTLACMFLLFVQIGKSEPNPAAKYSFLGLVIIFLGSFLAINSASKMDIGVLIEKQSTLRSGPSASFPDIMSVPGGARVKISERSNDWYKLNFVSDLNPNKEIIGWIQESAVLSLRHNSFITAPSLF